MKTNETVHLPHRIQGVFTNAKPHIAIVGCGGTGSILAEMLCRMLTGTEASLLLVDPDTVEPHTLMRQNFLETELGQPKSKALGHRLAQQFQRPVAYSVNDCRDILAGRSQPQPWDLTICCVDNALARASLNGLTDAANWVLDTGNGREDGQALLGNLSRETMQYLEFQNDATRLFEGGKCYALPSPATQQPDLLVPQEDEHADHDRAQAILLSEQSPLINQAMALTAAQFAYKLLTGKCSSMAVYLNLARATTTAVPATPANAARILNIPDPESLME